MSMISSLDALEAATDASSAPRAAVFQPKVKPRARKGGGGDTGSIPAKPVTAPAPPPAPASASAQKQKVSKVPADPFTLSPPTDDVAPVSQFATRASAPENAESVVDINGGTGKESFAGEDGSTPRADVASVAALQKNASGDLETASESFITELDSVQTDDTFLVQDEVPPVAVRSNFPLPSPARGPISSDEGVELAGSSSPEQDRGVGLVSEPSSPQELEEADPSKSQSPGPAPSPKRSKSRRPGLKRKAVEDSRPLSVDAFEDGGGGEEQEAAYAVEEESEAVAEAKATSKRGRKRIFSHSTSQPRMNRPDRDGVALKVDFSKTDLSNPGKLTMREIIRRAEAIERKKLKEEANKKLALNDGKQTQVAIREAPERDVVAMAPQVQVINGRIVINEQSLTVGAYATSRLNTETYTRVEENAPRLNYNSYRDKIPTERWKTDDTDVFYLALKQFGTDFELIQNLFPGRTRRQVKAKFKKEERNNPRRLQEALAHRPKDQAHYTDMINRLKGDETDPRADDPFTNILAYTKNVAAEELADGS